LLSKIVGEKGIVFGIEYEKGLVEKAKKTLNELGIQNVETKQGDGAFGWPEKSPFDRILVSAACPYIPPNLFHPLKERGIIVAPVGDSSYQQLVKMEKFHGKPLKSLAIEGIYQFVPLRSPTFKRMDDTF
jgi:protein-L-isoaspartate(D-aspartate) O-methyltransferase